MGPDRQGLSVRNRRGECLAGGSLQGRSQLLVYHFMFGPDYTAGCPSCSSIADGFNGFVVHLENHDVAFSAVSRAPLAKLQAFKQRMGWTFPWVSSFGCDFNSDFSVLFTEQQQREGGIDYNFRREPPFATTSRRQDRSRTAIARQRGADRRFCSPDRNRRRHIYARQARPQCVRARRWRRISHLFQLFARAGRPLGHVSKLDRDSLRGATRMVFWWRHHDKYARG